MHTQASWVGNYFDLFAAIPPACRAIVGTINISWMEKWLLPMRKMPPAQVIRKERNPWQLQCSGNTPWARASLRPPTFLLKVSTDQDVELPQCHAWPHWLGFWFIIRKRGGGELLVGSNCHNKILEAGEVHNRHLFLMALEAGSPRPGCQHG